MSGLYTSALVVASLIIFSRPSVADEVERIRAKAQALKAHAAEIAQNGREEEAERLLQESEKLISKASQIAEEKKADTFRPTENEIGQLKERLQDLRTACENAEKEGRSEPEQNEIRQQIQKLERKLNQLQEGTIRKDREIPAPFREQAEKLEHVSRRIHHMRTAAENLKAAELHEMAHDLMAKADAMEQESIAAKKELMKTMSSGGENHDSNKAVQQLRSENAQLKRELNELREAVQHLKKEREK